MKLLLCQSQWKRFPLDMAHFGILLLREAIHWMTPVFHQTNIGKMKKCTPWPSTYSRMCYAFTYGYFVKWTASGNYTVTSLYMHSVSWSLPFWFCSSLVGLDEALPSRERLEPLRARTVLQLCSQAIIQTPKATKPEFKKYIRVSYFT